MGVRTVENQAESRSTAYLIISTRTEKNKVLSGEDTFDDLSGTEKFAAFCGRETPPPGRRLFNVSIEEEWAYCLF